MIESRFGPLKQLIRTRLRAPGCEGVRQARQAPAGKPPGFSQCSAARTVLPAGSTVLAGIPGAHGTAGSAAPVVRVPARVFSRSAARPKRLRDGAGAATPQGEPVAAPSPQRQQSAFARVLGTKEYRVLLILMVLMALGFSSAYPLVALYLVKDLGAALPMVGVFFSVQAVPGLLAGVLIGRWSDRWRSRLPFLRAAIVWVGAGWVFLAGAHTPLLAIAIGAVFLSVGGVLMGQVFAILHDVMTRAGEAQPEVINSIVRTGWSFGWVFGPLVGTAIAAQAGIRTAFITAMCLYLLCLIPLMLLKMPASTVTMGARPVLQLRTNVPLLAFTALCALVICGQAIKSSYLPIDVTEHLRGSVGTYGKVAAVSPIVELFVMPLSGMLAQRAGLGRIIAMGLAIAIVEYLLLTASSTIWQVYLVQAMDACVVAVVMGLGVSYAQRLSPQHPGAANGIFFSSFSVSAVLGGLVGSVGVPHLGVPHIFLVPAVFCTVACGGFLILERTAAPRPGVEHARKNVQDAPGHCSVETGVS